MSNGDSRHSSWFQENIQSCVQDAGEHALNRNNWQQLAGNILWVHVTDKDSIGDVLEKHYSNFPNLDRFLLTREIIYSQAIIGFHLAGPQGIHDPNIQGFVYWIGNQICNPRIRIL
jgi:hypothetical protein